MKDGITGRIPPIDPATAPPEVQEVFARQTELWGAPLAPTLVMAHCPPLVRGGRRARIALEKSGQLARGAPGPRLRSAWPSSSGVPF